MLHTERAQHFGRAAKSDLRRILADRLSSEKDWDKSILTPWQAVAGVAGHLQDEFAVSTFVKEATSSWSLHGQSTENKRSRRESEVLARTFPVPANALDRFDLANPLPGNDRIGVDIGNERPDSLQLTGSEFRQAAALAGSHQATPGKAGEVPSGRAEIAVTMRSHDVPAVTKGPHLTPPGNAGQAFRRTEQTEYKRLGKN
ncbi:MAG: hypothetical protein M3Y27_06460 [Acidobacteriota bacterium]|nr:hypothetical protein [Acidobacteriota bacterium]